MFISGFQKMTLLDYPGKVAATIFTGGCNLRCPFCHNALLVTELDEVEAYPEEEVLDVLQKRVKLLEGVAITGGEPLLQPDIIPFLEKVKAMGYPIKLDHNGTRPEILKEIINRKLVDYVAIDIKNCKERYGETVGVSNFNIKPVEETIDFLLKGSVPYEFRTTIVSEFHGLDEIGKIGQWIQGAERYYLQNFVDSGNLIGENMHSVAREMLFEMKTIAAQYVKLAEIRGID